MLYWYGNGYELPELKGASMGNEKSPGPGLPKTEIASQRFAHIDNWSSYDLVAGQVEGQMAALGAVHAARTHIATAVDLALPRLQTGGRLIYAGAGTSGRIATQDAAELLPTFNWPAERAIAIMAGGDAASTAAIEGAEDSAASAISALDNIQLNINDVVIGVAASGQTPFTLAALEHAGHFGALTIAVINNPMPDKSHSDVEILALTGMEFLAGSTRLKAGTAQKIILNTLSTALMVKLGYVYRGLMVEMQPTNKKLQARAVRIVAQIAGTSSDEAEATLISADWVIKRAAVMLSQSCTAKEADTILAKAGGILRTVMER